MKPIRHSTKVIERFKALGIDHLSPSALDSWISERAKYYLRYIAGFRDVSPMMWRGSAVEEGLYAAMVQQSMSVDEVVAHALDAFQASFEQEGSLLSEGNREKVGEQKDIVIAILEACADQIRALGVPNGRQMRINGDVGIEIPSFGYADIVMPDRFLEIKTTQRMPSDFDSASEAHKRQSSFYSNAAGKPIDLVYVGVPPKNKAHTGLKIFSIPQESVLGYVRQYHLAARSLRRAVMVAETPEDLAELCIPDFDNFRWDEKSEAEARKIWSIEEAA